ncbi:MAG: excinuclease ABC subunit B, partial [Candidatus Andersenbacteria bacterium CG10_big_fil_rev_8_21_14_0_10_54_11]
MAAKKFKFKAPFKPAGDQPHAIAELNRGLAAGQGKQTLLGVTGAGKTAVMGWIIENAQKPTLIISHNKTLAAQLAEEFKAFFPDNAVEYFVSYYDYYQPEAYIARTDTYIAKDSAINEEIDRLRHAAMESILTRRDVIVVASVSCIYGLGTPREYFENRLALAAGQTISRREILQQLTHLQYTRNDIDLVRGAYRVRGDIIDIHPAGEDMILRIETFGDRIERLAELDPLTGEIAQEHQEAAVFPATFFMTSPEQKTAALASIRTELAEQIRHFRKSNLPLEAERIEQRTTYDLEMIEHVGYCSGIENYSRHFDGRVPGRPPATLIDYFRHTAGNNFLTIIDESHMTIPQLGAMHGGDSARKDSLVRYGFRLPSARDNRPLKFNEFEDKVSQTIFVSATPGPYENRTGTRTVQLIVRPTGLVDPPVDIEPTAQQVDDVITRINERITRGQRTLVTTLTKRMAEELATYLIELNIKAAYLHADIDTLERLEILRDLRTGAYDVLVGINLLREGLDLPEVSLVAIMDADKEGYLRSET